MSRKKWIALVIVAILGSSIGITVVTDFYDDFDGGVAIPSLNVVTDFPHYFTLSEGHIPFNIRVTDGDTIVENAHVTILAIREEAHPHHLDTLIQMENWKLFFMLQFLSHLIIKIILR